MNSTAQDYFKPKTLEQLHQRVNNSPLRKAGMGYAAHKFGLRIGALASDSSISDPDRIERIMAELLAAEALINGGQA